MYGGRYGPYGDDDSMMGEIEELVVGCVVLIGGYCAWQFFHSPAAKTIGKVVNGGANMLQWSLSSPFALILSIVIFGLMSALYSYFKLRGRIWVKKQETLAEADTDITIAEKKKERLKPKLEETKPIDETKANVWEQGNNQGSQQAGKDVQGIKNVPNDFDKVADAFTLAAHETGKIQAGKPYTLTPQDLVNRPEIKGNKTYNNLRELSKGWSKEQWEGANKMAQAKDRAIEATFNSTLTMDANKNINSLHELVATRMKESGADPVVMKNNVRSLIISAKNKTLQSEGMKNLKLPSGGTLGESEGDLDTLTDSILDEARVPKVQSASAAVQEATQANIQEDAVKDAEKPEPIPEGEDIR